MRSKLKTAERAAEAMAANITDLQQRKAAAETELEAVNAERRQLALAGLTGDGTANDKLSAADDRATAQTRAIENFSFAISEAEAQLQRLQQAIDTEQQREAAAEVQKLLAEREALAAELDSDLAALAAKFKRLMDAGREIYRVARTDMGWVDAGLRSVVVGRLGRDEILGWSVHFHTEDRNGSVSSVVRGADGVTTVWVESILGPEPIETAAA